MKLRIFLFTVLVLALGACGGKGSSSSGSGESNASQFVGNYTGTARLTLSAQGVIVSDTSRVFIAVRPNGQMDIYFDGELVIQVTSLTSNVFSVTDSAQNAGFENCSGTVSLIGNIKGNTISGSITSKAIVCQGVSFTATGSINATKVANARASAKSKSSAGTFGKLYQQF